MVGNRHKVLLVDDEADTRESLRRLLELKGYAVDTAENGKRALEIVRQASPPCMVLLDLLMPWMNGWEFCAELRKHERLADLPVVILSAVADRFGGVPEAVAQLRKPIDLNVLYQVLEEHC